MGVELAVERVREVKLASAIILERLQRYSSFRDVQ